MYLPDHEYFVPAADSGEYHRLPGAVRQRESHGGGGACHRGYGGEHGGGGGVL